MIISFFKKKQQVFSFGIWKKAMPDYFPANQGEIYKSFTAVLSHRRRITLHLVCEEIITNFLPFKIF